MYDAGSSASDKASLDQRFLLCDESVHQIDAAPRSNKQIEALHKMTAPAHGRMQCPCVYAVVLLSGLAHFAVDPGQTPPTYIHPHCRGRHNSRRYFDVALTQEDRNKYSVCACLAKASCPKRSYRCHTVKVGRLAAVKRL